MNKKQTANRKRNRIGCQLNDKEYVEFKNILAESGMTQQAKPDSIITATIALSLKAKE